MSNINLSARWVTEYYNTGADKGIETFVDDCNELKGYLSYFEVDIWLVYSIDG